LEFTQNDTFPKYHTTLKIYADLIFIQKGRSESIVYLSNEDAPVPRTLVERLAAAAAAHMSSM
jgi:hypothetical protein